MLYADDEPSAEVYSAASDRSQASLVFNVAKQIVEMTPALMKRSKIMAATKRIVNYSNAGFYQVLSADVGCVSEDTVLQLSDGSLKRADEIQPGSNRNPSRFFAENLFPPGLILQEHSPFHKALHFVQDIV